MRNGCLSFFFVLLGISLFTTISTQAQATDSSRQYLTDSDTQLLYHFSERSGSVAKDASGKDPSGGRDASYNGVSLGQDGRPFFDTGFSSNACPPGTPCFNQRVTWTAAGGTGSFLYPSANHSFTIEGWIKLANTTFTHPAVLFTVQPFGNATPDYQLVIKPSNDSTRALALVFADTNKYLAYTGPLSWRTDIWYHVAIVVTQSTASSTYTLYRTPQFCSTAKIADQRGGSFLMLPVATDTSNRVFSIGNFYGDNGNDYFPGVIDEVRFSTSARAPENFRLTLAPTVQDKIRTEAMAPNSDLDHALPLAGSWNDGANGYEQGTRPISPDPTRFGFSPDWQVDQIEAGHYLLPWFAMPSPNGPALSTALHTFNSSNANEYSFSDYYSSAMRYASSHKLPIAFIDTWLSSSYQGQWEADLYTNPTYRDAAIGSNPNFVCSSASATCTPGAKIAKLSAFGYTGAWNQVGEAWGGSTLLADLQGLYSDPPKVLFISNNEARKEIWSQKDVPGPCTAAKEDICTITDDQHYYNLGYSASDPADNKIMNTARQWAYRYSFMRGSWKGQLSSAWQSASQFIGYNAFGPANYARANGWQKSSLAYELSSTNHRMGPHPTEWDGASMQQYVGALGEGEDGTVSDDKVWGVAMESMNQEFMLKEALALNSNYWFELSTWNGCDAIDGDDNPTCWSSVTRSDYTPQRYAGSTQFSMWVFRPRSVREFRGYYTAAVTVQHYFDTVIASVDKVHNNPILYSFWRNSTLVSTEEGASYAHPYRFEPLGAYGGVQRMFLLKASANPSTATSSWTSSTQLTVMALARVQGEAGHRRWLIYAFSPRGPKSNVGVLIPGYGTNGGIVSIDTTPGGVFYLLDEQSGKLTSAM